MCTCGMSTYLCEILFVRFSVHVQYFLFCCMCVCITAHMRAYMRMDVLASSSHSGCQQMQFVAVHTIYKGHHATDDSDGLVHGCGATARAAL